jgi:AcrR family transcriptional regulator
VSVADRQERYDEKLVQILQSACGIFAEKGYHHASVRDVAAATGVSPAGLYYYFRSKEELLFLILDHCLESLLNEVNLAAGDIEDPRARLQVIIRAHLGYFATHSSQMRVLAQEWEALSGEFLSDILGRQREYSATILRTLKRIRPGTPRRELRASAMALFGMLSWTYQWYVPDRDLSSDELASHFAKIFLEGFPSPSLEEGEPRLTPARGDPDGPRKGVPPSILSGPGF